MNQDALMNDQKTQSAVIMQLALIGNSRNAVLNQPRRSITVPWREIAGFRDRAIHDYYQIDLQVAWGTILQDLDPLTNAVKTYLGH